MNVPVDETDPLFPRVQSIISTVTGKDIGSISPEKSINDLIADSIELFRLIMALEKEFEHRADYRELMNIETVADTVAYIRKVTKGNASN